jgi:hypothetical protein
VENQYARVTYLRLVRKHEGPSKCLLFYCTQAQCSASQLPWSLYTRSLLDLARVVLTKSEGSQSCTIVCDTKIPLGIQLKLQALFVATRLRAISNPHHHRTYLAYLSIRSAHYHIPGSLVRCMSRALEFSVLISSIGRWHWRVRGERAAAWVIFVFVIPSVLFSFQRLITSQLGCKRVQPGR